jgi:hypothetical protein
MTHYTFNKVEFAEVNETAMSNIELSLTACEFPRLRQVTMLVRLDRRNARKVANAILKALDGRPTRHVRKKIS